MGGRPTLVQNVETLAHVALMARFGAQLVPVRRDGGLTGHLLVHRDRSLGVPRIVEMPLGVADRQFLRLAWATPAASRRCCSAGTGAVGLSTAQALAMPTTEEEARRNGSSLGAGVVALLPSGVCPLAEMSRVARYMESQKAGQCGPCIHGLAELATAMEALTWDARRSARPERILEVCNLVEGRGACRHPDGVARFVRSGLQVFADEVASHQRNGSCRQVGAARVLPGTGGSQPIGGAARAAGSAADAPVRRLVSRS